jgi:predicted acylesterase/phospholipase RssA
LSGGANKGAYEAGVIHGLTHLLKEEDVYWDVVSGVSAGALNGGGIATWPIEQPKEMAEWLVGMWMNMTDGTIFKEWPLGYTQGLFVESGVFNNQPLLDLVTGVLQKAGKIYKRMVVGAVDASSGNYVTFDEKSAPLEGIPVRVVSSASIPFVFPHRIIDNMTLMDGGTVWNLNLISAIDKCREIVDDDSQIVIDVISCARDFKSNNTHWDNAIGNFMKWWDIKSFNSGMRNIYEV